MPRLDPYQLLCSANVMFLLEDPNTQAREIAEVSDCNCGRLIELIEHARPDTIRSFDVVDAEKAVSVSGRYAY